MSALSAFPVAQQRSLVRTCTAGRKPWMGQESIVSADWWRHSDALVTGLCFLTQDYWKSPEATCVLQVRAWCAHYWKMTCSACAACLTALCTVQAGMTALLGLRFDCPGWETYLAKLSQVQASPASALAETAVDCGTHELLLCAPGGQCTRPGFLHVRDTLPSRGSLLLIYPALAPLNACGCAGSSQLSAWNPAPAPSEGTGCSP